VLRPLPLAANLSGVLFAEARSNLSPIQVNKKRNKVHYMVRDDEQTSKPIENKPPYTAFNAARYCKISPFIPMNRQVAVRKFISVFAEECLVIPKVKYLDTSIVHSATAVSVRIGN
jgi:hypothetical protein